MSDELTAENSETGKKATKQKETSSTELRDWLASLGPGQYKIQLHRIEPTHTLEGIYCKGYCKEWDGIPEDVYVEVEREWGGGIFDLMVFEANKSGVRKRTRLFLGGDPKMPPWKLSQTRTAGGGAIRHMPGNMGVENMSEGAQDLLKTATSHAYKSNDQLTRQLDEARQESARVMAENAGLKAQLDGVNQRMAALEAMMGKQPELKAAELTHHREMARLDYDVQRDTIKQLQDQLSARQQAAAEPYKQLIADIQASKDRELRAAESNQKMMLSFFEKQTEQQRAWTETQARLAREQVETQIKSLKDEIERAKNDKKPGMLNDLAGLSQVIEAVNKIKGLGGDGGEENWWMQLIDRAPEFLERLPQAAAAFQGFTGGRIPDAAFTGQGAQAQAQALPGAPDPAQAELAREQAAQEAEGLKLLGMVHTGYMKNTPPLDLAGAILATMGSGIAKQLISQPVEGLLEAVKARVPDLASMKAQQYVRGVYEALSEKLG